MVLEPEPKKPEPEPKKPEPKPKEIGVPEVEEKPEPEACV